MDHDRVGTVRGRWNRCVLSRPRLGNDRLIGSPVKSGMTLKAGQIFASDNGSRLRRDPWFNHFQNIWQMQRFAELLPFS